MCYEDILDTAFEQMKFSGSTWIDIIGRTNVTVATFQEVEGELIGSLTGVPKGFPITVYTKNYGGIELCMEK